MKANEHWRMVMVLAKVCDIFLRTATKKQLGMLAQTAKSLRRTGVTVEQVVDFGVYWGQTDWRGKRGNPPVPAQIRTEWGKYEAWKHALEKDELPTYT